MARIVGRGLSQTAQLRVVAGRVKGGAESDGAMSCLTKTGRTVLCCATSTAGGVPAAGKAVRALPLALKAADADPDARGAVAR